MMGQLNLLRMMNDVEPLTAMNTSFVLVQSLLLGGSSGQTSDRGVSERYLQHFRSPMINASSPLIAPHPAADDDNNLGSDWPSVGVSPTPDLLMPEWAYQVAAIYLLMISVLGVVMNVIVVLVILNDPQVTIFLLIDTKTLQQSEQSMELRHIKYQTPAKKKRIKSYLFNKLLHYLISARGFFLML